MEPLLVCSECNKPKPRHLRRCVGLARGVYRWVPWEACSPGCPGWCAMTSGRGDEIQRCDDCGRFASDDEAASAARAAIAAAPGAPAVLNARLLDAALVLGIACEACEKRAATTTVGGGAAAEFRVCAGCASEGAL